MQGLRQPHKVPVKVGTFLLVLHSSVKGDLVVPPPSATPPSSRHGQMHGVWSTHVSALQPRKCFIIFRSLWAP